MSSRITGPRRGAVAVLVVVMLVVLLGCTAFAIDFGRRFAFKAQLQTVADASAMAGALEVLHGRPLLAADTATKYGGLNPVENTAGVLDSIEPGFFTDAAGFTPLTSWGDPAVNAVRSTARYTVNYLFAPVVGVSSGSIVAQAIGAIGSQATASCLKPWAVPMANILDALGKSGENPETYDLTPDDVNYLRDNKVRITFKTGSHATEGTASGRIIPGNFYAVRYGPFAREDGTEYSTKPSSGAPPYQKYIAGTCNAADSLIVVKLGDWLLVENGNMPGPTRSAMTELCGEAAKNGGGPAKCGGDEGVEVDLPIWNKEGSSPTQVQVKYVGKFVVQEWEFDGRVFGYLTAKESASGGFTGTPGPLRAVALVH